MLIWKSKKVEVIFQNVDKDPKKKNAKEVLRKWIYDVWFLIIRSERKEKKRVESIKKERHVIPRGGKDTCPYIKMTYWEPAWLMKTSHPCGWIFVKFQCFKNKTDYKILREEENYPSMKKFQSHQCFISLNTGYWGIAN